MGQDVREWRRLRAWELHEAGWSGKAIAEALKASQAAVSTWLERARIGGVETLRRHPPPGRTPKLSAEQRAQLRHSWRRVRSGMALSVRSGQPGEWRW